MTVRSANRMLELLQEIIERLLVRQRAPMIVALDGPSGGGKSTIASGLAPLLSATVVPSDDFFAAQITRAEWEGRTAIERARDAIDWVRLRQLVLEPLLAGRQAVWHPFDFAAGERTDGSYGTADWSERRDPARVILVEGAYSTGPELVDLIDLSILIDAPEVVRRARLEARESAAFLGAWHERWDSAEAYYFRHVRPASWFDVVVDTESGTVRDQRLAGSKTSN